MWEASNSETYTVLPQKAAESTHDSVMERQFQSAIVVVLLFRKLFRMKFKKNMQGNISYTLDIPIGRDTVGGMDA